MMPRPPLSSTTVCYPLSVAPGFTLERALQGFARAGLHLAEIVAIPGYCEHLKPDRIGDNEIEETRKLLKKYELTPVAVNVAADLTTPEGVAFLADAMRVAHALGVSTVVTGVEQTETEQGAARFRELVPSIIDLAERYEVVVAFETHGGLVTTGTAGVQLLKEIGSECLKLTYDMANIVYYAGIPPQDDLAQMGHDIGRYIAHVHLKDKENMKLRDYNFPPFGMGILDFESVLQLLYQGGYRGAMTLEVELDGKPASPDLVDDALIQSYSYLQQFWTNSSGQARSTSAATTGKSHV
jgi:L-ribulose-5-phosphate 3-epimerase